MSPRRRQCDHNLDRSRRQWPKFGCEETSVTGIWMGVEVSDQNLALNRRQFWSYWRLLKAKFWSLTYSLGQILVTDSCCQPNSGHTDVFSATCITRILAFKADLKLKSASAAFQTPLPMFRGYRSMIYWFFSDHGWVPLNMFDISCFTFLQHSALSWILS